MSAKTLIRDLVTSTFSAEDATNVRDVRYLGTKDDYAEYLILAFIPGDDAYIVTRGYINLSTASFDYAGGTDMISSNLFDANNFFENFKK